MKRIAVIGMLILVALALFAQTVKVYTVDAPKCIGCTICVKACPVKAIAMNGRKAVIDQAKCIHCGLCEIKCPVKAISHTTATPPPPDSTAAKPKQSASKPEPRASDPAPLKNNPATTPDSVIAVSQPPRPIVLDETYTIDRSSCIGCLACVKKCPTKAIGIKAGRALIDQAKCIKCGICLQNCPVKSIDHRSKVRKDRL